MKFVFSNRAFYIRTAQFPPCEFSFRVDANNYNTLMALTLVSAFIEAFWHRLQSTFLYYALYGVVGVVGVVPRDIHH